MSGTRRGKDEGGVMSKRDTERCTCSSNICRFEEVAEAWDEAMREGNFARAHELRPQHKAAWATCWRYAEVGAEEDYQPRRERA